MKEMSEQGHQAGDATRARRKRIAERAGRVLGLLAGLFWLLVFLAVVQTSYLSSIGIAVAALLIMPGVIGSIAGLGGRKRLEKLLSWFWVGTIVLLGIAAILVLVWPEDHDTWRPYRFDEDLAAIEAERAVPDADNAARHYESILATIDVNDHPKFVTDGGNTHTGLSQIPWRSPDHPQASQWLDLHAGVTERLLQIGEMEKCRWPVYAHADCLWTVPYKKMTYGTWLLTVAGNRDLGEGRLHQALEKYLCLLRTADHLHQQTDTLDLRYSFSCEREALQMIRYILVDLRLSPEDTGRIADRLPTPADTWRRDISGLLRFDELRFAGLMASIYEINEHGKIRFAASFPSGLLPKDGQRDSSRLGRLWRLYWLMNMPLHPRGVLHMAHKESGRLPESTVGLHAKEGYKCSFWSFAHLMVRVSANGARFVAGEMCFDSHVVPRYSYFGEFYREQLARRRGTWLLLGLRRYRGAHGVWPDTLESVSEYVPAEAFFDPTARGAFVYAAEGEDFRLYSKGPNGIDEGSRHGYMRASKKFEDDIWIWPPPVPEPEPSKEEIERQMEEVYGKDYRRYMK